MTWMQLSCCTFVGLSYRCAFLGSSSPECILWSHAEISVGGISDMIIHPRKCCCFMRWYLGVNTKHNCWIQDWQMLWIFYSYQFPYIQCMYLHGEAVSNSCSRWAFLATLATWDGAIQGYMGVQEKRRSGDTGFEGIAITKEFWSWIPLLVGISGAAFLIFAPLERARKLMDLHEIQIQNAWGGGRNLPDLWFLRIT